MNDTFKNKKKIGTKLWILEVFSLSFLCHVLSEMLQTPSYSSTTGATRIREDASEVPNCRHNLRLTRKQRFSAYGLVSASGSTKRYR